MNKKILNIITAIVMLLAFFMPWIKVFGFGGSAFDAIRQLFNSLEYVDDEPTILLGLFLLLFPICAIIVLIYYAKAEIKKGDIGVLQFAKKTPLVFLIIVTVYGFIKMGDDAKMVLDSGIVDVIGMGFILTIISAIVLFVDKTKVISFSQDNPTKEEPKEEANTDDLFN